MPWRLALGVRGTVAGHRLGALEPPPIPFPMHPCPPPNLATGPFAPTAAKTQAASEPVASVPRSLPRTRRGLSTGGVFRRGLAPSLALSWARAGGGGPEGRGSVLLPRSFSGVAVQEWECSGSTANPVATGVTGSRPHADLQHRRAAFDRPRDRDRAPDPKSSQDPNPNPKPTHSQSQVARSRQGAAWSVCRPCGCGRRLSFSGFKTPTVTYPIHCSTLRWPTLFFVLKKHLVGELPPSLLPPGHGILGDCPSTRRVTVHGHSCGTQW